MPLRDHFRSPLDDLHSWDGLHAGWPMVMVQHLIRVLPEQYFALPGVYLGSLFEVDIGTFRSSAPEAFDAGENPSGVALATYAPPQPTRTLISDLISQDVYEVRIYDRRRNRQLVAAIEIISPSNKDRPEHRERFVAKVAALLAQGVCVSIIDLVSTMDFNFYEELLATARDGSSVGNEEPSPMYAVTLRTRYENDQKLMDAWYYPLTVGQPLPTLPIWLTASLAVSLETEATYEETCQTLRIR